MRNFLSEALDWAIFNFKIVLAIILVSLIASVIHLVPGFDYFFQAISGIFSFLALIVEFYKGKLEEKKNRELKERFEEELKEMVKRFEETLTENKQSARIDREKIVKVLLSKLFPSYRLSERITPELQAEAESLLLKTLKDEVGISEADVLLTKYTYLSKFNPDKAIDVIEKLDKGKIYASETTENNFLKKLYELENEEKVEAKNDNLNTFIASKTEPTTVLKKIGEIAESTSKYNKVQIILNRIINKGHISTKGLLALIGNDSDIFCIIKSENGLSGEIIGDKQLGELEKTPFKKVLENYGFVAPYFGEWFTFMIPANKIAKKYRSNIDLFMQEEILPKVEAEWISLKEKYQNERIQRGPDFKYIAFIVPRHLFQWESKNSHFYSAFEKKILAGLNKEKTLRLLLTQTHNVKKIIGKMEIDNLLEKTQNISTAMINSLKFAEDKIKRQIKKSLGLEVQNILDYGLIQDKKEFGKMLLEICNANLLPGRKRKRKTMAAEGAQEAADIIVNNAQEYREIIENLGISNRVA